MEFTENNDSEQVRYSFRTYVIAGYAIVAAATAISIIAIVATVFNMYFTTYAAESTSSTAHLAANVISDEYSYTGSLDAIGYSNLVKGLELEDSEHLAVLDSTGNEVYSSAISSDGGITSSGVTSSSASSVSAQTSSASSAGVQASSADTENSSADAENAVSANILSNGTKIGEVRVWSDTSPFMTRLDTTFRDETYRALIVAGLVATLIALCFGLFFSRILTAPIKQISRTAKEISRGNLSARTGITGDNEIANLGETFDAMAASIERDRNHEKRLTSDVAHELRTPLMAIQATVEAMIDGVYDRDDGHLQMVDDEVKRLSRMVDALLQLSRLENRTKPVNLKPNNLGELASQEVSAHEMLIIDSGKTIELHDKGDVWAMCDIDMIRQALANLISNAIRYTDTGGRIDVYVRKVDKWAEIAVADTGIGLDPEEEKMVFERFWRADSDRGRKSGGLGIGLSVVREIVAQNSGEISVKGVKGEGATFTIKLPACPAAAENSLSDNP